MKFHHLSTLVLLLAAISLSCSENSNPTETTSIFNLSTSAEPSEAGVISPSQGEFESGDQVEITATPNEHWVFESWQGDHAGSTNPVTLTMDTDKSITAMFLKRDYPLTIEIEGEGSVSEQIVQSKTSDYPHGTVVELTATPAEGWEFVEWQGKLSGNENPKTITVEEEATVVAVFEEIVYTIEVTLDGEGLISIIPEKEFYDFGEEVTITVEPAVGWYFVYWGGDLEDIENPLSITLNSDLLVNAVLDSSPFEGGNGTDKYPYQISTIEQLQHINNYLDKHFIQINDIDASVTDSWNGGEGFQPIGDDVFNFIGAYDGGGFDILSLYINRPNKDNVGLFGYSEKGAFSNITLSNAFIIGSSSVGAIIGRGWEGSIISNSAAEGFVSGYNGVGGLSGSIEGKIINSNSSGAVEGNGVIGGLTGSISSNYPDIGGINNSWSSSSVNGILSLIGGLSGIGGSNVEIVNSYANGYVEGDSEVGGLVGRIWRGAKIINSYSDNEKVVGKQAVGGLVGINSYNIRLSEVIKSFSRSNVEGEENVGGLIGDNQGNVENTYSNGNVIGILNVGGLIGLNRDEGNATSSYTTSAVIGSENIGSLVGGNASIINDSYWNYEMSGVEVGIGYGSTVGDIELTNSQMQGSMAQENMTEFDWIYLWKTTDEYPILRWQDE